MIPVATSPLLPSALYAVRGVRSNGGDQEVRDRQEGQATHAVLRLLRRFLVRLLRSAVTVRDAETRLDQEQPHLRRALEQMLIDAAELGVRGARRTLGARGEDVDWAVVDQNVTRWARTYSYSLVKGINATSRQVLQDKIPRWAASGKPLPALEKELAPHFGATRARMIAATEVTRAYAEGHRQSYKVAGLKRWRWYTAVDERVCPTCGPRHGRTYPLDAAIPPAHPRCRCWISPVVDSGLTP